MDSSFKNYIRALENSLAANGKAFFLLRPLDHHGFDLFSDIQNIVESTSVTKISHMRGSDIILLEK